jgi:tRNA dimethylallyltransferase
MKPRLLVIAGPTASGKSDLALELAEQLNGEIICVDSLTVYRGLAIGSAKPTLEQQQRIPHHLLDICEPTDPFTAADFRVAGHRGDYGDALHVDKRPILARRHRTVPTQLIAAGAEQGAGRRSGPARGSCSNGLEREGGETLLAELGSL